MGTNIVEYLPSKAFVKKLAFLIVVLTICFGVAFLFQYLSKRRAMKLSGITGPEARPILLNDVAGLDVNGNSVPDWIEYLNGGTAPNQTGNSNIEVNETEQLARDIFTTAASTGQVAPLSEQGVTDLATQVADRIAATQTGETFDLSDIKTIPDSKKNEDAYVANIIKLLDKTYPLSIDTSLVILQTALDAEDPAKLAGLAPISERYKNLIAAFKGLSVPMSHQMEHLEFLNILGKARGQIETMRNAFVNPVLAMSTFINYPETLSSLVEFISPFTTKIPYSTLISTTGSAN